MYIKCSQKSDNLNDIAMTVKQKTMVLLKLSIHKLHLNACYIATVKFMDVKDLNIFL